VTIVCCVRVRVRACACVREKERERESVCVCVLVSAMSRVHVLFAVVRWLENVCAENVT
jgi:hypothetical protein